MADKYCIMKAQEKREERKREREMRNFYYGSDDGYDYAKDNRNGEVDSYVEWVMELKRKEKEEKEMNTPKN
jgi:hypothetical protein